MVDFFVHQIFLRHGAPKEIITDMGQCFVSDLPEGVPKALETNQKITLAYNPKVNEQVERMNYVLADILSKYTGSDHKGWYLALPFVCLAYKTSIQESSGFTPFYLLYGRLAVLPVDIHLGTEPDSLVSQEEGNLPYDQRLLKRLKEVRDTVIVWMDVVKRRPIQ